MAQWQLKVLGDARLECGETSLALERRTAGALAYLALEGPTPKYRLAGILWPGSGEERARNNMRQLLRRLRLAAGAELLSGTDVLQLAEGVVADAAELGAHVLAGRNAQALRLEGALLGTLDYGDSPDFEAWLHGAREGLDGLRRRAAAAEADRCEAAGQLEGALVAAEQLLALEPLSEDAFRRLMRLHYLRGERAAALGVWARCQRVLREELGVAPLPETAALARDLERGRSLPRPGGGRSAKVQLPLTVLRPPVLVGREREWARMEEAWEAGRAILLVGEPGVGKSRLACDFAASRGAYAEASARPGDPGVPYATHARTLDQLLRRRPDLPLEPWVRYELARLLPTYAEGEPPPMLPATEADRLRFFEGTFEVIRRCTEGLASIVVDDMQFLDAATLEFASYMQFRAEALLAEGRFPRFVDCARRGEIPPGILSNFLQLQEAGALELIELGPLPPAAVEALLGSLELPGAAKLSGEVARYTGGNPLYITETLKHLVETGSLERGWPERLPPPGRVRALIQQRLRRLSPAALQLAQVAALALSHFTLELAGEVLEASPLSLGLLVTELEAAQLLAGERFTHDLVLEAVREAVPAGLAPLLHRRLALALERRGAPPAVVGRHWVEGGDAARAAPLLAAAAQAEAQALHPASEG